MFATFTFPLGLNVAVLFWSMYAIDRRTVFPQELDSFFPSWLNHILHTNVALFIIIEMFISNRQYPSRKAGVGGLLVFMFGYLVWLHVIRFYAGRWTYPILDILNPPSRIAFFAFTISFPVLMYFLGECLNKKIWSKDRLETSVQSRET